MVATRNITDLASLTAPGTDDVLLIVDRLSATSSEVKQISWANVTEAIQDIVASLVTDTTSIDFEYDDDNASLTASVLADTTVQKSIYSLEGVNVGSRQELNFADGTGINVVATDNTDDNRVDVTVNNTGVVSAVNNAATDSVSVLSGTPVQSDGSKQIQLRPLKVGSTKLTAAVTDDGNSITFDVNPTAIDINSLDASSPLAVTVGGTGSTNASDARTALGAASSGVNSDVTEIQGLTTALTVTQGGTGSSTAGGALYNIGGLKTLESVGSTSESIIADGSASVSNEYRGQLKTIRPFSNKVSVSSSVNNEVTIDVNADNVLAGATQSINFNGQRLTNVAPPLSSTDGVNKAYADSVAQGLTVKLASRVSTINNIAGSYFNVVENVSSVDIGADTLTSAAHAFTNGDRVLVTSIGGTVPAGLATETVYFVVGTTTNTFQLSLTEGGSAIDITDTGTGTIQVSHNLYLRAGNNGALTIDGVTLDSGDRILLQDQTDATQNGIYVVSETGDATSPAVLTRAFDFNISSEMVSGSFTFVSEGTVNAGTAFVQITKDPIIDVSNIQFSAFSTVTLQNGIVTNSKLADMATATIKGRESGSTTGAPSDLSANQVVAIINTATVSIDSGTY